MDDRRRFAATPTAVASIRRFVEGRGRALAIPAGPLEDLVLGVSEAATNAVIHSGSRWVEVSLRPLDSCLEVRVADEGVFRVNVPLPELTVREGGRGLPVMMAVADEMAIRRGTESRPGTVVRLVRCWAHSELAPRASSTV